MKLLKHRKGKEKSLLTTADGPVGDDSMIADEVLRSRIRKIIDEPKAASWAQRFSKNPLTSLIIGFLLTGIIASKLTNYYTQKQAEIEFSRQVQQQNLAHQRDRSERALEEQKGLHQRQLERDHDDRQKRLESQRSAQQQALIREKSFADELSKRRVEKIGEVWEKIYAFEAGYQEAIAEFSRTAFPPGPRMLPLDPDFIEEYRKQGILEKKVEEHKAAQQEFEKGKSDYLTKVEGIFAESRALDHVARESANMNRFWIGEDNYTKIIKYMDTTNSYTRLLQFGTDRRTLKRMEKQRERLRQTIIQIRNQLLTE